MENNFETTENNLLNQTILYLYSKCDLHRSNQVPLSNLLGFINSPKFVEEYAEVKEQYYLNGETLGVSLEMFVRIVFEWVRSKGLVTSANGNDETSRCDIYYNTLHSYSESNLGFNTISERVKELNHKNKQLNTELEYTKNELGHLDEQYNLLQVANDKLSQELVRCNKTISELSSARGDTQEISAVIEEYEKTIHKLKKSLAETEKDNAKMKNSALNTAHTTDHLQEMIEARSKNEEVMSQLIAELEVKLLEREGDVSELLETNSKLRAQIDEQSQLVLYYTEQDRLQKDQVKQMDTTIQDYRWRFSILNTTVFSSPKPQSPRPEILTEIFNFNTPRLLRNLANPVSPSLDLTNELNDSDEACAQLLLSRCSNNNVSLYDEMVMFVIDSFLEEQINSSLIDVGSNDTLRDKRILFNTYWNMPTFQCARYNLGFDKLALKYNIIQNDKDQFRGNRIALLYDPGLFPAIIKARDQLRNGGVPQEGNLSLHLNTFAKQLDDQIPDKNFSGIAVIDFESWRPIYRQNFGTLMPYKDLSVKIEKERHPLWSNAQLQAEAERRFEKAGRKFVEDLIVLAKKLRPNAKWGYYAFPYCFNYQQTHCAPEVQQENDRIKWMFSASDNLHPSVYFNTPDPVYNKKLIIGRLTETQRVLSTLSDGKKRGVSPYYCLKYDETRFLTKEDIENSIRLLKDFQIDDLIVWGSSNHVNTQAKCVELYEYIDTVFGPALFS
ncbi:hypothetical protein FQR65_LT13466 [Abscondita terminalis]|nr:hypothetical protein FQR65_LT13466 [Abscondita terminalis]